MSSPFYRGDKDNSLPSFCRIHLTSIYFCRQNLTLCCRIENNRFHSQVVINIHYNNITLRIKGQYFYAYLKCKLCIFFTIPFSFSAGFCRTLPQSLARTKKITEQPFYGSLRRCYLLSFLALASSKILMPSLM